MASFASGTWTTPDGRLLIESFGEVPRPDTFLIDPENRSLVVERLSGIFSPRVAGVAGLAPKPGAKNIPFLVMCGSLDPRYEIARQFVQALEKAGYRVESEWPRTPHGSRTDAEFQAEFKKYSRRTVEFFLGVAGKY